MKGIYGYWDVIKQKVVYIGQSRDIEGRLKSHMQNSLYNKQKINQILQNNPKRYESFILTVGDFTDNELNELEHEAVEIFKTNCYKYPENEGFNFKDGGNVKELPDEIKKKISESHKGKNLSEETKKKISEAHKDKILSEEHKQNISKVRTGIKLSEKHKKNMSEVRLKKYARIIKSGHDNKGKQQYAIRFNGKNIKYSLYPDKLLKWFLKEYPLEIIKTEGL